MQSSVYILILVNTTSLIKNYCCDPEEQGKPLENYFKETT